MSVNEKGKILAAFNGTSRFRGMGLVLVARGVAEILQRPSTNPSKVTSYLVLVPLVESVAKPGSAAIGSLLRGLGFPVRGVSPGFVANKVLALYWATSGGPPKSKKDQDPNVEAMKLQEAMQKQSLLTSTLSNLANMRHEMNKAIANNLRG